MAIPLILWIALVVAAWIISITARRLVFIPKVENVPLFKFEGDNSALRYIAEAGNLLAQGYEKYTKAGRPFAIRNAADPKRPLVILPMQYLEEVKNAPQSRLSFPAFLNKASVIKDICGPLMTEEVQKVTRIDLNKALSNLIGPLQVIIAEAFDKELPPSIQTDSDEWTTTNPHTLLTRIFARVAAYVLVGPELSQDESQSGWLSLSRDYVSAVTKAPGPVRHKYPPYLRWVAKYFEPSVKLVLKYRKQGAELLRPTLEKRLAELETTAESGVHQDAIQWFINELRSRKKTITPDTLVQSIFSVMTAAIDSTSATALWMLFDLLQHPDALADIREEIANVTSTNHSPRAHEFPWARQSLSSLYTLDSFMRESLRLHSFTQITVERMAMRPYTFKTPSHDGNHLHIPQGTQIAFARYPHSLDPSVNPDPLKFDYKRHLNKRLGEGKDSAKYHFASVGEDTLAWGAGLHACPGRFLAQEVLKLLFVNLVTRYEVEFEENKGPGKDKMMGLFMAPDVTAEVRIRKLRM